MWSEAHTNVQVLATLNEQFYAENGIYAPCMTDEIFYEGTFGDDSDDGIEDILPTFRPGTEDDLKFAYKLVCDDDTTGQEFHAMAELKSDTTASYSIDHNGEEDTF
jgi:hypothetical protein